MAQTLEELKAEYGVDTGNVLGSAPDPDNPPLLISRPSRTGRVVSDRDMSSRGQSVTATLFDTVRSVYRMNRADLVDLQQRLWNGGFYGKQKPVAGDYDGAAEAYGRAALRAARFHEVGVDKTLDEVIDEATRAGEEADGPGDQGRDAVTGANVGGGGVHTVNLADPASLRSLAEQVARSVLGRNPTAEEQERAVTSIRAAQEAQQRAEIANTEGQRRRVFDAQNAQERAKVGAQTAADNERIAAAGAGMSVPGGREVTADFVLETGRSLAGQYGLKVTSHKRSAAKNAAVGGARKSDHLTGHAVDLAGDPKQMAALAAWAKQNMGPGKMFRYVEYGTDDHKDHVHLSFNKGTSPGAGPGAAPSPVGESRTFDLPNTYVDPAVATVEQVDPAARVAEQMRAANPAEAKAHDISNTFATFLKLIGA
jgi:hypothetical protein